MGSGFAPFLAYSQSVSADPVEDSGSASLITQTWNQVMEWLKRLETLREYVATDTSLAPKPLNS